MTLLQTDNCQTNDSKNSSYSKGIETLRFPLDTTMRIIFTGYFNGFSVEVRSSEEMSMLHHMGCFGKGSLSRSKPRIIQADNEYCIMRRRQFQKRNDWCKKFSKKMDKTTSDTFFKEIEELTADIKKQHEMNKSKDVIDLISSDDEMSDHSENAQSHAHTKLFDPTDKQDIAVIVPNSDSEEENYFEKLKPECCLNKTKSAEKLMLSLQEAFFLSFGLGCLQILNSEDVMLSTDQLWELFIKTDKNFVRKYVVYHYFRSKGYIVKSGIKFGGEYLLYTEVPSLVHADYIVVIKDDKTSTDWVSLLGHVRMALTAVKEVLMVELCKPDEEVVDSPENLSKYSVREVIYSRKNQMSINDDE